VPKFRIIVSRDIVESATVEVDAPTLAEAQELAIKKADALSAADWGVDDFSTPAEPYVGDPEDPGLVDDEEEEPTVVPCRYCGADSGDGSGVCGRCYIQHEGGKVGGK
jgi:hypothetical protein